MLTRMREFRADDGYARWERWTDWPMVALALIFLFVLILPLAEPINPSVSHALDVANVLIWALFAADYLLLLYLATERRQYVRTHVVELIVVVVPFLRPFRLLRLFAIVASTTKRTGGHLVQRVTVFAVCVAVIVMATSAVVVFDAEKSADPHLRTIHTLGDSMWWGVSTVTTLGYGDVYPVTPMGRLMAVVLMLTGISLLGIVTAAVAAWFVNIVRSAAATGQAATVAAEHDVSDRLSELTLVVDQLSREVSALRERGLQRPESWPGV